MNTRYFCTYFDQYYLPRALALYISLRKYCPDFKLFIICLDDVVFDVITKVDFPEIIPIPLNKVEKKFPELLQAKANRSRIEYYFTLTPFVPLYLLNEYNTIDIINYVDADLYFYSSPEPLFTELEEGSVAIIPHRFSPGWQDKIKYGIYNVGWISYRNDENGRKCLEWYAQSCAEWCYDRLEDGKFGDQAYLNDWPVRFKGVVVISHKGANVANYNIDNYELTIDASQIIVDNQRLIFYHFCGISFLPDGKYYFDPGKRYNKPGSLLFTAIFEPYAAILDTMIQTLKGICPQVNFADGVREKPENQENYLVFHPQGWDDDFKGEGWNENSVASNREKHFNEFVARVQANGSLTDNIGDHNTVMCFAYVVGRAAFGKNKLDILDWGGVLGEHAILARSLYPGLEIDYHLKEVSRICALGRKLNSSVHFHETDETALARNYNLVMASSAVQYVKDWEAQVLKLAEAAGEYFFLHRVPVLQEAPSFVVWQKAYGAVYQGWFINAPRLLALVERAGFKLVRQMPLQEHFTLPDAPEKAVGMAYLWQRR